MPIVALLLFGGATLKDFAFALLIGVASGAYSSIFIASPVLTHWKEREPHYRARRRRIEEELGEVPAYAQTGADVEPERKRPRGGGRLTTPEPETVSAAEFEQMKRDLEIEQGLPTRHTSTLTQRLAHLPDGEGKARGNAGRQLPADQRDGAGTQRPPERAGAVTPEPPEPTPPAAVPPEPVAHVPAPDIAENEGVAPVQKPKSTSKPRTRNRRHGRRR
jgi:SecD/SecF fusion protein